MGKNYSAQDFFFDTWKPVVTSFAVAVISVYHFQKINLFNSRTINASISSRAELNFFFLKPYFSHLSITSFFHSKIRQLQGVIYIYIYNLERAVWTSVWIMCVCVYHFSTEPTKIQGFGRSCTAYWNMSEGAVRFATWQARYEVSLLDSSEGFLRRPRFYDLIFDINSHFR